MKANETPFLDFLRNSRQLVIPPYQRAYCWTERQCRRLWDDIIEVGESTEGATHFIGSIIYVEQDYSQITHRSPHLVIDGQQRLTTVTLLLEALARTITGAEAPEGFSPRQIRRYYLYDHLLTDDRRFRLLLTEDDRESLLALVASNPCRKTTPDTSAPTSPSSNARSKAWAMPGRRCAGGSSVLSWSISHCCAAPTIPSASSKA